MSTITTLSMTDVFSVQNNQNLQLERFSQDAENIKIINNNIDVINDEINAMMRGFAENYRIDTPNETIESETNRLYHDLKPNAAIGTQNIVGAIATAIEMCRVLGSILSQLDKISDSFNKAKELYQAVTALKQELESTYQLLCQGKVSEALAKLPTLTDKFSKVCEAAHEFWNSLPEIKQSNVTSTLPEPMPALPLGIARMA